MKFKDNLIDLRKSKGWSQEELGNKVNVSRQTVSKWETGETTPEMTKLIALSELFETGLDELVKGEHTTAAKIIPRFGVLKDTGRYEYKSKRSWRGIPLIHINLGRGFHVARGIIAIGNIALGAVAIGGFALGIISIGGLAIGLLSIASFAFGLTAIGGICAGLVAVGGIAIGCLAMGGVVLGIYSAGGCAIARDIAIGGYAQGFIAVGQDIRGTILFSTNNQNPDFAKDDFIQAVEQYFPEMNRIIRKIFTALI